MGKSDNVAEVSSAPGSARAADQAQRVGAGCAASGKWAASAGQAAPVVGERGCAVSGETLGRGNHCAGDFSRGIGVSVEMRIAVSHVGDQRLSAAVSISRVAGSGWSAAPGYAAEAPVVSLENHAVQESEM